MFSLMYNQLKIRVVLMTFEWALCVYRRSMLSPAESAMLLHHVSTVAQKELRS